MPKVTYSVPLCWQSRGGSASQPADKLQFKLHNAGKAPRGRVLRSHDEDAPSSPGKASESASTLRPCLPPCTCHSGLQRVQKKQMFADAGESGSEHSPLDCQCKAEFLLSGVLSLSFLLHDFLQAIKRHQSESRSKGTHACLNRSISAAAVEATQGAS